MSEPHNMDQRVIFITGNSRSGTTMMMRVMNKHKDVHAINEPHFFEGLWVPSDESKKMDVPEAENLCRKLLTRQRNGYFAVVEQGSFSDEIATILDSIESTSMKRSVVFSTFIHHETTGRGKSIPCDKTPQNVFYIGDILELFPNSQVIHMVRDPRSVLLSQKNKWRRKFLGSSEIPWAEVLRLRVNYHPFTVSKLWNSSASAYSVHSENSRVRQVKFEALTDQPTLMIAELCSWLSIPNDDSMLNVPYASSSTVADSAHTGIKKTSEKWREQLTPTEIYLCQKICKQHMQKNGYTPITVRPNILELLFLILVFPFKILASFVLNISRMRNMAQTLNRRLSFQA